MNYYTYINHNVRKKFFLNITEYCVLDSIAKLSLNTGFCIASKKYLAEFLDISERQIFRILKNLEAESLIRYKFENPLSQVYKNGKLYTVRKKRKGTNLIFIDKSIVKYFHSKKSIEEKEFARLEIHKALSS